MHQKLSPPVQFFFIQKSRENIVQLKLADTTVRATSVIPGSSTMLQNTLKQVLCQQLLPLLETVTLFHLFAFLPWGSTSVEKRRGGW